MLAMIAPILSWIAVSLVTRVLLTLGFGVATYYGIGALFGEAETFIWSNFGNTTNSIVTVLGMARVDDFIKVILSAYLATLQLRGLTAAGSIAVGKWLNTAT